MSIYRKKFAYPLRRVNGSYHDDESIVVSYDFDVKFDKIGTTCMLSLITLLKFSYPSYSKQDDVEVLLSEVEKLLDEKLKKLKIEMLPPRSNKCCCSKVILKIFVSRDNSTWVKNNTIDSQPQNIVYNPDTDENGEEVRSNAGFWAVNDPAVILHEVMHLFGVNDEYLDRKIYPNKTIASLPKDHKTSIMGPHTRSISKVGIKPRHIEQIFSLADIFGKELKDCNFKIKENK